MSPRIPPRLNKQPDKCIRRTPREIRFAQTVRVLPIPTERNTPPVVNGQTVGRKRELVIKHVHVYSRVDPLENILNVRFAYEEQAVASRGVGMRGEHVVSLTVVPFDLGHESERFEGFIIGNLVNVLVVADKNWLLLHILKHLDCVGI